MNSLNEMYFYMINKYVIVVGYCLSVYANSAIVCCIANQRLVVVSVLVRTGTPKYYCGMQVTAVN